MSEVEREEMSPKRSIDSPKFKPIDSKATDPKMTDPKATDVNTTDAKGINPKRGLSDISHELVKQRILTYADIVSEQRKGKRPSQAIESQKPNPIDSKKDLPEVGHELPEQGILTKSAVMSEKQKGKRPIQATESQKPNSIDSKEDLQEVDNELPRKDESPKPDAMSDRQKDKRPSEAVETQSSIPIITEPPRDPGEVADELTQKEDFTIRTLDIMSEKRRAKRPTHAIEIQRPNPISPIQDLTEIAYELRMVISALNQYLYLIMPLDLSHPSQVKALCSWVNTRPVLEKMSTVPLLVHRAAIVALDVLAEEFPKVYDAISRTAMFVENYARHLQQLTLNISAYAYTPCRSPLLLAEMTDCAQKAIVLQPPVFAPVNFKEFLGWLSIVQLMERVTQYIKQTFLRYLVYLESPLLRADIAGDP